MPCLSSILPPDPTDHHTACCCSTACGWHATTCSTACGCHATTYSTACSCHTTIYLRLPRCHLLMPAAAMLPPAQPPVASTLLSGPVASLPEPEVSMPEGPALPKPEVLWAVWTCHAHARGLFFVGTYSTYHSLSCSATVGSSIISLVICHAMPPLDLWSASELFLCHCQICSRPPEQFLHRCRTRVSCVALGLMNIVIQ